MEHCTYVSCHAIGKFYIGKATVKSIKNGYKGGGVILKKMFNKYPRKDWNTTIIQTFTTAAEAYAHEATLVTQETLDDPDCINLALGGVFNYSTNAGKRCPRSEATKAKLRIQVVKACEAAAKANTGKKRPERSPEWKAKISASASTRIRIPHSQSTKDKIAAKMVGNTNRCTTP